MVEMCHVEFCSGKFSDLFTYTDIPVLADSSRGLGTPYFMLLTRVRRVFCFVFCFFIRPVVGCQTLLHVVYSIIRQHEKCKEFGKDHEERQVGLYLFYDISIVTFRHR